MADHNNNVQSADYFQIIINGKSSIRKFNLTLSINDAVEELLEVPGAITRVTCLAKGQSKADPNDGIEVDPYILFEVLKSFGCNTVVITVKDIGEKQKSEENGKTEKSIFDVLMKARRSYDFFPQNRTENNKKDGLFNAVVNWMKTMKWGFTSLQAQQALGKTVVTTLTEVLWYLDPLLERLKARGISLPDQLKHLTGFRNLKGQHKKIPQITLAEYEDNIEKLSELLMLPWCASVEKQDFRQVLENTIQQLKKYSNFLTNMQVKSSQNHKQVEPVRNFNDNWSISVINSSKNVKPQYAANEQAVRESPNYKTIDLINFEPQEKEARRCWLKDLALYSTINLFVFRYGNYMGNLNIVWKIPDNAKDRQPVEAVRIVNLVKEDVYKYATRRMRRNFINTYNKKCKVQPVLLRNMFHFLTNFEYTPNNPKEGEIDERLIKFLLESDDCEAMYDLRSCNGRPNDPKFEPFWDGLENLIEEKSVVHERRHNDQ